MSYLSVFTPIPKLRNPGRLFAAFNQQTLKIAIAPLRGLGGEEYGNILFSLLYLTTRTRRFFRNFLSSEAIGFIPLTCTSNEISRGSAK